MCTDGSGSARVYLIYYAIKGYLRSQAIYSNFFGLKVMVIHHHHWHSFKCPQTHLENDGW